MAKDASSPKGSGEGRHCLEAHCAPGPSLFPEAADHSPSSLRWETEHRSVSCQNCLNSNPIELYTFDVYSLPYANHTAVSSF